MHRMVSFWVLIGILAVVAVTFYRVMAGFLLPLFLAALLAVIFQPVHVWALRRSGNRPLVAATMATVCVVLIVFVPLGWALSVAIREGLVVANHFDSRRIATEVARLRVQLRLDLPLREDAADVPSRYRLLERFVGDLEALPTDELASSTSASSSAPDQVFGLPNSLESEPPPSEPPTPPGTRSSSRAQLIEKQLREEFDELRRRASELEHQLPMTVNSETAAEVATLREHFTNWQESLNDVDDALRTRRPDAMKSALVESQSRFQWLSNQLPAGISRVWARDMLEPSSARWKEFQDRVVRELQSAALPAANATLGFVLKLIFGVVIMFVSLFFFFADGHRMAESVMKLIPLDIRHQHELLEDFTGTSRAVVLATLVSAFVQGTLAGLGFWATGVDSVMLLTIMTMVFAMVPFVGAFAVWAPVSLWILLGEGRTWPAVLLAIWGGLIVSQSDNVVKPMILKGQSNLHPLLALLSILGGVATIGPAGILIGPLVVVFLQTLLRILHRELTSLEGKEGSAGASEGTQTA